MAVVLSAWTPWSQADALGDEYKIMDFGPGDDIFLQSQHELAESIVYDTVLTRLKGSKEHDLRLLQQVIDRGALKPHQKRELQALGSVLGELLAKEFRLPWEVYSDQLGRSRGLRIDNTRQVIFPLTMISRRIEADANADINRIYAKAVDIIRYTRANSPLYSD